MDGAVTCRSPRNGKQMGNDAKRYTKTITTWLNTCCYSKSGLLSSQARPGRRKRRYPLLMLYTPRPSATYLSGRSADQMATCALPTRFPSSFTVASAYRSLAEAGRR